MPNILLRRGSAGRAVAQAQRALNFHLSPRFPRLRDDGVFGPVTESRVMEFQRRNRLTPDGVIGPVTRGRLFAVGVARLKFQFKKSKEPLAFGPRPGFRLQPGLVGDGPAPAPPQSKVVLIDWGQTFTFSPFVKFDDTEEHLLTTDLRLALKNNGDDDSIIGLLKIDLPPGQPILPNWQFKAELEKPIADVKIFGPLEANMFTTQGVQLSPFQLTAGAGVKLGLKIFGDKIGLFAQGDLKMQYTPEEKKLELTPSASGNVEIKF